MKFFIKFALTIILIIWAIQPFIAPSNEESVLSEIYNIGIIPSLLIMLSFFVMVAFYCRTLQRCLTLISPENRKAKPNSVWYMFAIPFNFVEDFFIVINVANSIEGEKKSNVKLKNISDFGMVSGIGWSIAQVLSFIPNYIGQIAGVLGMVLVIHHWILITRINKLLVSE